MKSRMVKIRLRNDISKETAEFLMNVESYLTIKGEFPYSKICTNANSKLCKKCEQPDCDLARGLMKK